MLNSYLCPRKQIRHQHISQPIAMNIVKVFASILTVAGMLLLIYACLAIMGSINTNGNPWGVIAPVILGAIFFGGGLFLFRYLVSGGRAR